jgi:hypothetical protein
MKIQTNQEIKLLTKEIAEYDNLSADMLELINEAFTFQPNADLSCLKYPYEALNDFLQLCKDGMLEVLIENLTEYVQLSPKKFRWVPEFLGMYHDDDLPDSKQVNMWVEHQSTGEPFGFTVDNEEIPD